MNEGLTLVHMKQGFRKRNSSNIEETYSHAKMTCIHAEETYTNENGTLEDR